MSELHPYITPNKPVGLPAALAEHEYPAFIEDAKSMDDHELAERWSMTHRTAINWRLRLVGRRPKKKDKTQ